MTYEIIKTLIPVITFILGSLFTLFLKGFEARRATIRKSTTELSRLTRDWYTQIHQLFVVRSNPLSGDDWNLTLFDYAYNRLILPEVLLHLEILKKYKKAKKLVARVEAFLELVTNYRDALKNDLPLECPIKARILSSERFEETTFLKDLDYQLQLVVREASKLL